MNAKVSWKFLLAALAAISLSSIASAQGFGGKGGGFSGKGGGGFDPAKMFEMMAKGKDHIDLNDVSPWFKSKLEDVAKKYNITNGKIPRDIYIKNAEERMKAYSSGGSNNGSGGGVKFGGPGGGGNGPPSFGGPGGNFGKGGSGDGGSGKGDSGKGGPSGFGGSGGGPPGFGKGGDSRDKEKEKLTPEQIEERAKKKAEEYFKDRDDNKDGFLNTDEMSRTLREHYKKYDKNNDNMITLEETVDYMRAWEKGEISWRNNNNNNNQGGSQSNSSSGDSQSTIDLAALEERPEVFGGGKLPSGLPGWFSELDTDKDGQVGLYEWFAAKKDVVEFRGFDRNKDGFLTFEEILYHQQMAGNNNSESSESPGATISSSNGNGNGNGGNGDKSGGKYGKFGGKGGKDGKKRN